MNMRLFHIFHNTVWYSGVVSFFLLGAIATVKIKDNGVREGRIQAYIELPLGALREISVRNI